MRMPDGSVVTDSDRNYMSIAAKEGDLKRINMLREVARAHGIEEGQPLFLPGYRKIDDVELEHQKERMEAGLIPDEYDIPAWREVEQRGEG
jgi:hypothetical protein